MSISKVRIENKQKRDAEYAADLENRRKKFRLLGHANWENWSPRPCNAKKRWWKEFQSDPVRYEAYRAKLREAKIRNPVWNKDVPCREETKRKLSAKNLGKPMHSQEFKDRISEIHKGNQWRKGMLHSDETKHKMSLSQKGKHFSCENRRRGPTHPYYSKPMPKGTGVGISSYCLKGYFVRSSWEREVADWLYLNGVEYEYEERLFDLGGGLRYRPDFHLTATDSWIEVKGYETPKDREKFSRFIAQGHKLFIFDKHHWRLFQETGTLRNIIAA